SSSHRCGLLNPYLIQGSQCLHNTSAVKDYLTRAFCSTYDIFLAPFIEKRTIGCYLLYAPSNVRATSWIHISQRSRKGPSEVIGLQAV
nr:ulp1 protease family, C-terminal catalytic domain-containing protein [Tanacetum cinerariifolium]